VKKVLAIHWQEEVLNKIAELAPSNWHVRSMTNSVDAMLETRTERYDLIFCCLSLPMVTGIELIRSVRSLSVNKDTPIIILSDGAETEGQRNLISKLQAVWLFNENVTPITDFSI
jgi:DNA-binding response OmpR family regulator